jgi:hypothetical protein
VGSKKLSKHECGLKRRGSPRWEENPKKIGSLNPQTHLLHSSAPSSGRSRVLNPVRRTSVRQPNIGTHAQPGFNLKFQPGPDPRPGRAQPASELRSSRY